MNRALLKLDAKDAMNSAHPHPALTTLAFLAVSFAASLIMSVFGMILEFTSVNGALTMIGTLVNLVVSVIFTLLIGTVQYGYYVYSLKVFKLEDTGVSELFEHFHMMLKVFGLSLYIGLFTSLWSMLFVIPGIIAALRYSQAFYVLAENPDMSIRDCVKESKHLMKGHLWEYVVLNFSFFFWILLTAVTFGIALFYVMPYMQVTMAGYYLSLKPVIPYDAEY